MNLVDDQIVFRSSRCPLRATPGKRYMLFISVNETTGTTETRRAEVSASQGTTIQVAHQRKTCPKPETSPCHSVQRVKQLEA